MRVFKEMNKVGGSQCPICRTQDDGEVVLIAIAGTREGFNAEAAQFHVKCIELTWNKRHGMIYQTVPIVRTDFK